MKRVLIFGAGGRVGSTIERHLSGDVDHYQVVSPSRRDVDCSDLRKLHSYIGEIRPDFIVNCAGYVGRPNVDQCELSEEQCRRGNIDIPLNLGYCCDDLGIRWAHVSTGCIYDGYEKEFTEEDPPNFCCGKSKSSLYSIMKRVGETVVGRHCYCLRIRMPFDYNPIDGDYISKLLTYQRLISIPNSVTSLTDFTTNISRFIDDINIPFGVYNMVNSGSVSSAEIITMAKNMGYVVNPTFVTMSELRSILATDRSNCVLSNAKSIRHGCKWQSAIDITRNVLLHRISSSGCV